MKQLGKQHADASSVSRAWFRYVSCAFEHEMSSCAKVDTLRALTEHALVLQHMGQFRTAFVARFRESLKRLRSNKFKS